MNSRRQGRRISPAGDADAMTQYSRLAYAYRDLMERLRQERDKTFTTGNAPKDFSMQAVWQK